MRDRARCWQDPHLEGMTFLEATFFRHSFGRHYHQTFAVGVTAGGTGAFYYRGSERTTPAGSVIVIAPGEMHTGRALGEAGWTYRLFYPGPEVLRRVAEELDARPRGTPGFRCGVVADQDLAKRIFRFHAAEAASPVERETALMEILTLLIRRHADGRATLRTAGRERRAIRLVKEYIEARFADRIRLAELAEVAGLSPFHLVRTFRREVGLPPHAYLTQVRVERAKKMISAGISLADVAYAVGFTDQSHLTRSFRKIVGVTPGYFARSTVGDPCTGAGGSRRRRRGGGRAAKPVGR
ncbi:MAG: AraC family transcriptional regulator [Deltaproteobacteria bacterium]|nr:AraC family transcriptional regulator [Deltaproteobacteria bacterium]